MYILRVILLCAHDEIQNAWLFAFWFSVCVVDE